jgi:SAM-dependent MidA family methyltransferase
MNELAAWIREQIRVNGPVDFARFMEWALYHPEHGYYTGDRRKFGKEGDFYTAPGVNPVFAEIIADDLAERLPTFGEGVLTVIEFGAGEGKLARDLLNRWRQEHPEFYERVQYRIVEISPTLRERQRAMVGEHAEQGREKVVWQSEEDLQTEGWRFEAASVKEVKHANTEDPLMSAEPRTGAEDQQQYEGHLIGAVVTNELVDAYPVHRVVRTADGWDELYVGWDEENERFVSVNGPLTDPRLADGLARYATQMIVGQQAEVGLDGLDWYQRATGLLSAGVVLTIDYGFEAEMLYHPSRMKGTLRGFYQHQLVTDPFERIGEQDLTADVNFTALRETGEEAGWETAFFGSQTQYLLQAGILQRLADVRPDADPFHDPALKRNRAIRSMIMPGGMGDHFKVLLQQKGQPSTV